MAAKKLLLFLLLLELRCRPHPQSHRQAAAQVLAGGGSMAVLIPHLQLRVLAQAVAVVLFQGWE